MLTLVLIGILQIVFTRIQLHEWTDSRKCSKWKLSSICCVRAASEVGWAAAWCWKRMSETDRLTILRPHVVKRSHFLLNRSYFFFFALFLSSSRCQKSGVKKISFQTVSGLIVQRVQKYPKSVQNWLKVVQNWSLLYPKLVLKLSNVYRNWPKIG